MWALTNGKNSEWGLKNYQIPVKHHNCAQMVIDKENY